MSEEDIKTQSANERRQNNDKDRVNVSLRSWQWDGTYNHLFLLQESTSTQRVRGRVSKWSDLFRPLKCFPAVS